MSIESFSYQEDDSERVPLRESIFDRERIEAPEHYVSVYHETSKEAVSGIDEHGLKAGFEERCMQSREETVVFNQQIDDCRPPELIEKRIGHLDSSFAYPYLEYGHGCEGPGRASVAFTFTDEARRIWGESYDRRNEYFPGQLESKGIHSLDEFIAHESPVFRKKLVVEGEVLELKVDPAAVYVGDANHYSIPRNDERLNNSSLDELIAQNAPIYWAELMTLEDFLRWYRKPEWLEDDTLKNVGQFRVEPHRDWYFHVLQDAPENLPGIICRPEIIIPHDIPQEHIRVVPQEVSAFGSGRMGSCQQ